MNSAMVPHKAPAVLCALSSWDSWSSQGDRPIPWQYRPSVGRAGEHRTVLAQPGGLGRKGHVAGLARGLWNLRGQCVGTPVAFFLLGIALAHEVPHPRLAEKKASIGYTYEDSTVAEVEKVAEKPEEEESPAEEESNSDEDEVIPDIGGVPSLPSPPTVPGHRFCVSSLTLCGTPLLTSPLFPSLIQDTRASCSPLCRPSPLLPAPLCFSLISPV